jgi:hypothetical protein
MAYSGTALLFYFSSFDVANVLYSAQFVTSNLVHVFLLIYFVLHSGHILTSVFFKYC